MRVCRNWERPTFNLTTCTWEPASKRDALHPVRRRRGGGVRPAPNARTRGRGLHGGATRRRGVRGCKAKRGGQHGGEGGGQVPRLSKRGSWWIVSVQMLSRLQTHHVFGAPNILINVKHFIKLQFLVKSLLKYKQNAEISIHFYG